MSRDGERDGEESIFWICFLLHLLARMGIIGKGMVFLLLTFAIRLFCKLYGNSCWLLSYISSLVCTLKVYFEARCEGDYLFLLPPPLLQLWNFEVVLTFLDNLNTLELWFVSNVDYYQSVFATLTDWVFPLQYLTLLWDVVTWKLSLLFTVIL